MRSRPWSILVFPSVDYDVEGLHVPLRLELMAGGGVTPYVLALRLAWRWFRA